MHAHSITAEPRLPVLAIVVLYGISARQSKTLACLRQCRAEGKAQPAKLLVFDNGNGPATGADPILTELSADYVRSATNVGVAGAYEHGRQRARNAALPFLMLLDQDTDIGTGYFVELAERLTEFESDPTLAALAPKVYSNGQQVSPLEGWNRRPVSGQAPSRPGAAVMAINSGLVVRREFVDKLGGFDQRFWLDGLDHWLLLSIRARGMHIRVMETRIGHDLSVAGEDTYVSADRYRNILAAEAILFREAYTRSERIAYLVRLLLRACVYPLRWGTFKYTWPSLRQLALLSKR